MTLPAERASRKEHRPEVGQNAVRWGSRLGAAAFLFFLVKGLAWLIVPAVIAIWAAS